MLSSALRRSFISLLSLPTTLLISHAAQFTSDFNGGVPPGTTLVGNAAVSPDGGIGNSGVLKLTAAAGGQQGTFYINDFSGGAPVTNFIARYKLVIGGGTARPADGMAFAFGTDIGGGSFGEEGAGTGISVTFDTWDNNGDDTAPAIDVRWGGAVIAFQSMDPSTFREGGRAPAGPVLTNSAGQPVNLQTFAPQPAAPVDSSYVNVVIELFSDNTISVSYSNVVVF